MRYLYLFILMVVFSIGNHLSAKETIKWYKSDSPPSFILEGPMKGKGSKDLLVKYYQERMPIYEHKNILSNLTRFMTQVKKGENWCHPRLLKTAEREKFLYYSKTVTLSLPNHLIVNKTKLNIFDANIPVSLEKIFQNKELKGRLFRERSYGIKIDPLIKLYKSNPNLKLVTKKEKNLFKMLLLGRIDYTINYPTTVEYIAFNLKASGKLMSIPLKETIAVRKAYFGCTKNSWGKKVSDQINIILESVKKKPEYRKLVTEVWLDENASRILNRHYDQMILGN